MSVRPVNFDTLHCDKHPHWSLSVEWRPGRWDPMTNAPREGYPILNVRGRQADGTVIPEMHYACGDGDGLMPPFDGWFAPYPSGSKGFHQVRPVEWQPLTAGRKAFSPARHGGAVGIRAVVDDAQHDTGLLFSAGCDSGWCGS